MENGYRGHDEAWLSFEGALDASGTLAAQTEAELALRRGVGIVADLGGVEFLDPSGIGLLVFLFKRQKAAELPFRIVGVHGQPARLLRQLRLERALGVSFNDNDKAPSNGGLILREAS